MTNRLTENGIYPPSSSALVPAKRRKKDAADAVADAANETEKAVSRLGVLVKTAPAASLLVALTVGLAIGFWVKRR